VGFPISPPCRKQKESSSFLKKRTKKLLRLAWPTLGTQRGDSRVAMEKSFLVLFFKKEHLSSFL
jgi:hypothetical protein